MQLAQFTCTWPLLPLVSRKFSFRQAGQIVSHVIDSPSVSPLDRPHYAILYEWRRKGIMMISTMTRGEAQALRAARDTDARLLSRKPKHELVAIYQSEGGYGGGHWFRDDLIGSILEKRFPVARHNEAGHVLHHGPGERWSACGLCQCQVTWTVPSELAPGHDQLMQCVLDPGHRGFCRDDQGRERNGR